MKKSLKVLVSLVLIVALLMSYAPSIVLAAPQAPSCERTGIYALNDVMLVPPFKSDGTANTTAVVVKEEGARIMHFTVDNGTKLCYCIEPGAGLTVDSTIDSAKTNKYWTALKKSSDPKHQKIVTGIYRVVALADHMNPTKDADVHAIAQIVLWEIICGIRDPITGEALKTTLQNSFANLATTDQETYYTNRYKQFVTAYKEFDDIPSFMYSSKTAATSKPITLNWNATNKRYQATVTDSKGLLSKMNTTGVFPDYVHVSKSGNNLTIWTTRPITNALASSRINKNHGFSTSTSPSMLVYGGNLENGDISQALVAASVPDPMAGYMSIKTGTAPKINITVDKKWVDDNNRDGLRTDSVTANLFADGTFYDDAVITAAKGWKHTFTGLPEYNSNGKKIMWTITEVPVEGYETSYDGFTIINTHTTRIVKTLSAKTWEDAGNQDGLRPDSITLRLFADGVEIAHKVVTEADEWRHEFADLPKYRDGGIEIVYEIKEDPVPGYETTYDGYDIINTHIPEKITISGEKIWNDQNNQDGVRSEKVTLRLMRDGVEFDVKTVVEVDGRWTYAWENLDKYRDGGVEIVWTVVEDPVPGYETTYDGYNIINTHIPEKINISGVKTWDDRNNQDGIRSSNITLWLFRNGEEFDVKEITEVDGEWRYGWENLDKYENGQLIEWVVREDPIEGYTTTYDGYNITNSHTPATVNISGEKTWHDQNDQDGIRAKEVILHLMRDGVEFDVKTVVEVDGRWIYAWENLDKYGDGGIEIVWTVMEDPVPGYETTYDGYDIINTHIPEKTEVSGTKTWVDDDNRDGLRTESVTVRLWRDGEEFDSKSVKEVDGEWRYAWTDLDKYRDGGVEIIWTITEDPIDGYVTTYDGYNITNTHEIETITISGRKIWNDGSNAAELRPESVMLTLCADGEEIDTAEVTMTDAESPDVWSYEFVDLPAYREGKKISYTIMEKPVANYTAVVQGFDITNSIVPPTDSPKTGDHSRAALPKLMAVMAIAAVVSGGACIALVIRRRKQKRNGQ